MAIERVGRTQAPVTVGQPASVEGGESLLPQPQPIGNADYGIEIERLIVQAARNQRDVSRSIKQTARDLIERAHEKEVALMVEKADKIRAYGLGEGLLRAVEGGLMVGGGASGSDLKSKEWSGASNVFGAGGTVVRAFGSAEQTDLDAEIKQSEQAASRAKNLEELSDEMGKDATDLVRDARAFYREYMGAQKDGAQAALRRA
jgi:hypothetical protein